MHKLVGAALGLVLLLGASLQAMAQVTLRLFTGGQQRADVTRQLVEGYSKANPNVKVEIETGGSTSAQQQQYLSAMLAAKDPAIDLVLLDVVRAAQWAAAQWAEPLDAYLGAEKEAVMARYLPAFRAPSIINGRVIALPYFADALFLYYRKDLLEKYEVEPPRTWDELKAAAKKVVEGEKSPALRGLETVGAPVESAVCTFLVPIWGTGEDILKEGKPNLAGEAARKPFALWAELRDAKVIPQGSASLNTDRVRQHFQGGNLLFALNWGYVWNQVQNDADSALKDKIGVMPVPGYTAGVPATCLGGWQIAVSGFSKNKAEAAKLARYLSSPEVSKLQAILAGHLPVFPGLYADAQVLADNPWFAQALPALLAARSRPISPRYSEISETIRTNLNAFLAGTKSADAALADMNARLSTIFR